MTNRSLTSKKTRNPNEDKYFIRWRKDGKYFCCKHLSRAGLHVFIKRLIRQGVNVDDMEFWKE